MVNLATLSYLAVDDDPATRQIVSILLKHTIKAGKIALFEDSENFVHQLESLPFMPDVIFLDIVIQPLDGYEMLQKLKLIPAFQNAKIIALTAKVMTENVQRMKKSGFDGMISKPIIRQLFPELVSRIISGEDIWFVA